MLAIHSSRVFTYDWKNFLSATAELCAFTALSGLLIGFVVMFIGGFKGALEPQYFFGLKNWYEGLVVGSLIGLIAPSVCCTIFAFFIACATETSICLNSRFAKKPK